MSPLGTSYIAFIKLYGETLAGSIPACLSQGFLAAAAGGVIAVPWMCPELGTEGMCHMSPPVWLW